MALEALLGVCLGAVGLPYFALATFHGLRAHRLSNSIVWFCAGAAAGLAAAATTFWILLQLAPHVAVLAMMLALLVQTSAFTFVGLYAARKRAVEQWPV